MFHTLKCHMHNLIPPHFSSWSASARLWWARCLPPYVHRPSQTYMRRCSCRLASGAVAHAPVTPIGWPFPTICRSRSRRPFGALLPWVLTRHRSEVPSGELPPLHTAPPGSHCFLLLPPEHASSGAAQCSSQRSWLLEPAAAPRWSVACLPAYSTLLTPETVPASNRPGRPCQPTSRPKHFFSFPSVTVRLRRRQRITSRLLHHLPPAYSSRPESRKLAWYFVTSAFSQDNGMGTAAHVYNHASRPITLSEFKDAVEAVCRPRFPLARSARPQRIVLAISGGVDSMAMAFLVSKLLRTFRGDKIADNPAYGAMGAVIDHRLREGSDLEAAAVAKELRKLDIKSGVTSLSWKDELAQGLDPKTLPNLEGLARTYRYRAIGNICNFMGATSLFFAHHRDDQYETVLMRLLGGHGYRGLQGMREANSIPECYDMHGVYKSGLLDDQLKTTPSLSFRPALREMKRLRNIFRDDKLVDPGEYAGHRLPGSSLVQGYREYGAIERHPDMPYLKPLDTEDGGVMIYRPLLEFDKDRLIATCEANKVLWFEDQTNTDPTLTTRNAIRYLVRNHKLPTALQKPSILALAKRSKRRIKFEEGEAHRYLVREAIIKDFDPNAGTLLIELTTPRAATGRCRQRRSLCPYNKLRLEHRKLIMSIAIRKLIDFITPEVHLPPLPNLENVVHRLYPHLGPKTSPSPPKAFAIAGVLFDPKVKGKSVRWLLSRTPYPSNQPLPIVKLPGSLDHRLRPTKIELAERGESPHQSRPLGWKKAVMFDGRFWIRIGFSNRTQFRIQPFRPEEAKGFRKALSPMRRTRLERLLKHYAPGKIRYTLPALYGVERERDHYSQHVTQTVTMLALPTLGIHIQGLERWVRYEARYKKVDTTLLGHEPRGEKGHVVRYRPLYGAMRKHRRRRMYKYGVRT